MDLRDRLVVTRGWRKLHHEELYISHSQNILGRCNQGDEMSGTCSTHDEDEKCVEHCRWKNANDIDLFGELDIDRITILKWILNRIRGCGLRIG
jgi:hypothetical protein